MKYNFVFNDNMNIIIIMVYENTIIIIMTACKPATTPPIPIALQ